MGRALGCTGFTCLAGRISPPRSSAALPCVWTAAGLLSAPRCLCTNLTLDSHQWTSIMTRCCRAMQMAPRCVARVQVQGVAQSDTTL